MFSYQVFSAKANSGDIVDDSAGNAARETVRLAFGLLGHPAVLCSAGKLALSRELGQLQQAHGVAEQLALICMRRECVMELQHPVAYILCGPHGVGVPIAKSSKQVADA